MTKIAVRVVPNSSRTEVVGFSDGVLKVKIMEPPDDDRANRALVRFLEKKLGVKPIVIVSGLHSRNKLVEVGLSSDQIMEKLT
jgi:uncharacterized protein (TIGR00251 family)